jgi:hypothetical protein
MSHYQLVFDGKISPSHALDDVKRNLAELYRVDIREIDRLFGGRSIVLKRNLDHETASKDKQTFENTGALCRIVRENPSNAAPSRPNAGRRSGAAAGSRPLPQNGLFRPQPSRRESRAYRFFHPITMAFYSGRLYRDAAQNWKSYSFLYLFFVVALMSTATTLHLHATMKTAIQSTARAFIEQVPVITLNEGNLSIDAQEPYIIIDPENGRAAVIIDTTGQFTSLDDSEAVVLLTQNRMFVKKSHHETRILDLSGIEDFQLDQGTLIQWLDIFQSWFAVVLFPFVLVGSFFYKVFQVLVYALIGLIICKLIQIDLPFHALLSTAVIALTPALVISLILSILNLTPPMWKFLTFLLTLGFLVFGLRANRSPA